MTACTVLGNAMMVLFDAFANVARYSPMSVYIVLLMFKVVPFSIFLKLHTERSSPSHLLFS